MYEQENRFLEKKKKSRTPANQAESHPTKTKHPDDVNNDDIFCSNSFFKIINILKPWTFSCFPGCSSMHNIKC